MKNFLRTLAIIAICCTSQTQKAIAVNSDEEAFTQKLLSYKWSWDNGAYYNNAEFQLYEGGTMKWTFKSTVEMDTWRITGPRTIHITYPDGKFADLTFDKEVKTFSGSNWNHYTVKGARLEAIANSGKGAARSASSQSTSAAPTDLNLDPNQPLLEAFSQLAPNASAWVLAPLDEGVPSNVRQNLTYLREDLLDEYKEKPKANQEAYKLAHQLCSTMINALDERDQTLVRAGFRAVQADANTSTSGNQALNARRNYMMSWPQYAREESQRAELRSAAANQSQVMKEQPKVDWSKRTAALRRTLDDLYAQFREALRQSPAAK